MSCKRYQQMLHLNRSGEISAQEADELRQHLRLCERCALELQRIERADEFVDRFSAFSPAPRNAEKLTADLLRRIRAESAKPRPASGLDRVLDLFLMPSVRYSAVATILFITMICMTQLVMMLNDISDLEQRMASPVRKDAAEATYTVRSKTLHAVATSERGRPLRENLSVAVTKDGIDIPATHADTFLSDYTLKNLPAILETGVMGIDKKTLEVILNEVKATAELTFHVRQEGA